MGKKNIIKILYIKKGIFSYIGEFGGRYDKMKVWKVDFIKVRLEKKYRK